MTAGPATGAHLLDAGALSRFDLSVDCGAVVLGVGGTGDPVTVQLFRSRPTSVALVSAAYVARLLAVRALAAGATVAVAATRPQGWQPVTTSAPTGRAVLVAPGSPQPAESTPGNPLLRCDDVGPGGATARVDLGAWQARAVVLDFLPATAVPGLRAYDLVVVQRVQPDLVPALRTAFGLTAEAAGTMPRMPDDVVALLTPGHAEFIRLAPTPVETSLLGTPVRHDG